MLSIFGGTLAFWGYVGDNRFYLEWFFLVPILWALRSASPGRAFLLGWAAGMAMHAGGFYWIAHMLKTFAGFNPALSVAGLFLFSAFNGLSVALFAWAVCRLRSARHWSVGWTAPVVWTAVENVYPFIFPNYIGASQYPLLPFTQIADITGILGVSFLLIWGNATLYIVLESLVERRKIPFKMIAVFLSAIGITITYGFIRIDRTDAAVRDAPKIKTMIVQAGSGKEAKFHDPLRFIRLHLDMTLKAISEQSAGDIDLVIWPESVSIYPISRDLQRLPHDIFGNTGEPLLFGTLTAEKKNNKILHYTSAMLADEQNTVIGFYDKQLLVPFGEYIPFGDMFPKLYTWLPYTSRFHSGKSSAPLPFKNYRLSLNICYEDLFHGLIRHNMISGILSEKNPPHAMINLTNDSWYGDTTEPLEHLVLASFRSIEHRRALVRATNTGISAIIDPVGRLAKRTGQWTQETLVGEVPMMTGRTFFSYAGNWFGRLITPLVLIFIGLSYRGVPKTKKRGPGKKKIES